MNCWEIFCTLARSRSAGFGPNPLSLTDMKFVFHAFYLPREDYLDTIFCVQELDRVAMQQMLDGRAESEQTPDKAAT